MQPELVLLAAVETAEITPLEYMVATRLPEARAAVAELIEQPVNFIDHLLPLIEREWRRASVDTRRFLAVAAARSLPLALGMVVDRAKVVLERRFYVDLDLATDPERQIAANDPGTLFVLHDVLSHRVVKAWLRTRYAAWFARMARDVRRMRRAAAWYQADAGARFRALDHTLSPKPWDSFGLAGMDITVQGLLRDVQAQIDLESRQVRRPLKRVVKLFDALGYREVLARFLRHESVEMSHPASPFRFVVRTEAGEGRLRELTLHPGFNIPFDLRLFSKDGAYLGQLCAVVRQTPVLDQLLVLLLLIEAGEEREFLGKANWHELGRRDDMRRHVLPLYPHVETFLNDPEVPVAGETPAVNAGDSGVADFAIETHDARRCHWAPCEAVVLNWVRELFGAHLFIGDAIAGNASTNRAA